MKETEREKTADGGQQRKGYETNRKGHAPQARDRGYTPQKRLESGGDRLCGGQPRQVLKEGAGVQRQYNNSGWLRASRLTAFQSDFCHVREEGGCGLGFGIGILF